MGVLGRDARGLRKRVDLLRTGPGAAGDESPGAEGPDAAHRLAVCAEAPELAAALGRWRAGVDDERVFTGRVSAATRPVFVFPGLGPQWFGMGRALYAGEPAFRATLQRCDAILRADHGASLLDALWADEAHQNLEDADATDTLFPILIALQIALAEMWRAWGVEPAAVVGQSIGEVAAAQAAGILDTRDAMRVIVEMGRAYRASTVSGGGVLALVGVSPEGLADLLEARRGRVYLAGSVAPAASVLSGEAGAVREAIDGLKARGVRCRVLSNTLAHCPLVARFSAAMSEPLRAISPRRARVPFVSTVRAALVEGPELDATYWRSNLESTVWLQPSVQLLAKEGHRVFLEVSPHAILPSFLDETLAALDPARGFAVLASQLRSEDGRVTAHRARARLFTLGAAPPPRASRRARRRTCSLSPRAAKRPSAPRPSASATRSRAPPRPRPRPRTSATRRRFIERLTPTASRSRPARATSSSSDSTHSRAGRRSRGSPPGGRPAGSPTSSSSSRARARSGSGWGASRSPSPPSATRSSSATPRSARRRGGR